MIYIVYCRRDMQENVWLAY